MPPLREQRRYETAWSVAATRHEQHLRHQLLFYIVPAVSGFPRSVRRAASIAASG